MVVGYSSDFGLDISFTYLFENLVLVTKTFTQKDYGCTGFQVYPTKGNEDVHFITNNTVIFYIDSKCIACYIFAA